MARKSNTNMSFQLENLESRTLLAAATQINFPEFTKRNTDNLVFNGFSSSPLADRPDGAQGGAVELTSNDYWQSRSVWFDTRVPIAQFRTDFSFRSNADANGADGLTFTVLNGPTDSLGANGRGLGYGNLTAPSEAVAFNQYNFAKFGSKFGFASNGERPGTNTKMGSIDLHNGHTFKVTVTYDGQTMKMTIVDASDKTKTFSSSQKIDLKSQLGTADAIVGFTAATGANRSQQELLSWSFSGSDAAPAPVPPPVPAPTPSKPTIVIPANASPTSVTGTSATLDVLGDDANGESGLTYSWRVVNAPNGVKAPTYSDNKTNDAKTTTVFFKAAGSYRFRATITNAAGLSATSEVDVDVTQVATTIRMTPHLKKIRAGKKVTFRAAMVDQFGVKMATQPKFRFSILSGKGTIDSKGRFTAPETTGHVDVGASALGITGQVGMTVYPKEDRGTATASS